MTIIKLTIAACTFLIITFCASSCVVIQKDNGRHKGWYKNPNNPHHPATTNPGRGNGGGHGKGRRK
jgi:hypothetical protein